MCLHTRHRDDPFQVNRTLLEIDEAGYCTHNSEYVRAAKVEGVKPTGGPNPVGSCPAVSNGGGFPEALM
jgi:hypothetical protein